MAVVFCLNCTAVRTLKSHSGYLCGEATVHTPICDVITQKAWSYFVPFKNPYHICGKEIVVTAWVFSSIHSFILWILNLQKVTAGCGLASGMKLDVEQQTLIGISFSSTFAWSKHVTYTLSMCGVYENISQLQIYLTQYNWTSHWVGSSLNFTFGCFWFQLSAHRPANLRFFVVFLSPTRQMLIQYSNEVAISLFHIHSKSCLLYHSLCYDLIYRTCTNQYLMCQTCQLCLNVSKQFPQLL